MKIVEYFDPTIVAIISLLTLLTWLVVLLRREQLISGAFVNFGSGQVDQTQRRELTRHYRRQQVGAYWLLWIAVALGLLVAAIVLLRIVVAEKLDLPTLSGAIATCGNLWLGRFAWKFYQTATERLERFS